MKIFDMKYSNFCGIKKKPKAPWRKYYNESDLNIKVPDISVYNYFEENAIDYVNRYALDYYGNKIKYSEFLNKIDDCAKSLYSNGIRVGDVVTICVPNTLEGVIAFFAINKLGAIVNFIHPSSSENEIKTSLKETDCSILILVDSNYYKVKNIIKSTQVKRVVLVNITNFMPFVNNFFRLFKGSGKINILNEKKLFVYWNDFIRESDIKYIKNYSHVGGRDDPAIMLHSGGTTGTPKGVVLSNGNLIAFVLNAKIVHDYLVSGDVCLALMPIFHGFGIIHSILFPLCIGMYVVLRPKFDVKEYCKMIVKYKPQLLMGVPTLFEALLKEWNNSKVKLEFLKYVLVGGDSLKPVLRERINNFFREHGTDVRVSEGYGLSEAVCGVVLGIREVEKPGTVGIPMPGIYVGIFSCEDEEVPYGQEGEICVCGPTVMLGYFNNLKETNLALHVHKDGNVWLHTGDLGKMDSDGFVTYTSRLKRMIISSGYNVYPNRIEELLETHPAVMLCSVVGVKHKYKMEVPKAFIVLNNGYSKSELLIMEFKKLCSKNLPKYAWPYDYEFMDELPTTRVGKIDFRKLQKDNKKE